MIDKNLKEQIRNDMCLVIKSVLSIMNILSRRINKKYSESFNQCILDIKEGKLMEAIKTLKTIENYTLSIKTLITLLEKVHNIIVQYNIKINRSDFLND